MRVKSFYGFPESDAKRRKDLSSLLVAEKVVASINRSRTVGSISPVQCGLLRKRLLRSQIGDFVWKDKQKTRQYEGLL